MTPQQALINLYNASHLDPLTAEQHEAMKECAKIIDGIISPKDIKESVPVEPVPAN